MVRNGEAVVGAGPTRLLLKWSSGRALLVNLHLGAEARGSEQRARLGDFKGAEWAAEIGCPARGLAAGHIKRIHARLQVLVLTLDRAHIHAEEKMAAVWRPTHMLFETIIVGELAPGLGRGAGQIQGVDLVRLHRFHAFRDGAGGESEGVAVR